jgi:hypothetical protein
MLAGKFHLPMIACENEDETRVGLYICNDKRVAQQKLEEIVKTRQLEAAGMLPPEALRNAAQSPLEQHLKSMWPICPH